MIKYNGALLVCLMMASTAFAMEVREDLKGKTYAELKELERQNGLQQEAFDLLYPSDKWRCNVDVKQKRNAISDEGKALRNAIMMNGPRHLIKPHGITVDQPVVNMDDKGTVPADMKKYCRTIDEISASADAARKQKLEEQPQAQIIQKILTGYDELWEALSNTAQGKKGQELADIASQMDFIQDQKTALCDTLKKK